MSLIRLSVGLLLCIALAGATVRAAPEKPDKKEPDKKELDPNVNVELYKALTGRDHEARDRALQELSKMGADAVPTLKAALTSADPEARLGVLALLAKLGEDAKPALSAVAALLKDDSLTVRRQTALTLAALGPHAAGTVEALTEALRDKDRETRLLAAYALEKIAR
jgi:HEAT repeat protein